MKVSELARRVEMTAEIMVRELGNEVRYNDSR